MFALSLPRFSVQKIIGMCVLSAVAATTSINAASSQSIEITAPSFNCRVAKRLDERTICADPSLANLDVFLARTFEDARRAQGQRAVEIARSFTRDRADCRTDRECIRQNILAETTALRRLFMPTPIQSASLSNSSSAASAAAQTTQVVVQTNTAETAALRGQVEQLTALVRASEEQRTASKMPVARTPSGEDQVELSNIDENSLADLGQRFEQAAANRASYRTPTRPDDQDFGRTVRTASEMFPRVPYYIPGTRESGRFWVEPRVSETGVLAYDMVFVDPRASVEQKRAVIDLTPDQLERTRIAVAKLSSWSAIAHRNEVRRAYRKRVDCFPEATCPRENEKLDGKASTEVVFIVADDGSTAGRIQRNKGLYDEGYNVSIPSAQLLASYLRYVQSRAERDFAAGRRTSADLDSMFK